MYIGSNNYSMHQVSRQTGRRFVQKSKKKKAMAIISYFDLFSLETLCTMLQFLLPVHLKKYTAVQYMVVRNHDSYANKILED